MVVSFARANFRLSEDSIGIALEAVIGGYCGSLKVSQLGDRVFSFLVSSKQVGFHILNLRSYSCPKFKCFFHLWGHGGPNWTHEFKLWQKECNKEWTLVSPSKRRMQLGLNALKSVMPKPAIKSDSSTKKKLSFASVIDYNACKGYTGENASKNQHPLGQSLASRSDALWTKSQPSISFKPVGSTSSTLISNSLPSDNGNANKEIHDVPVVGTDSSSGDGVLARGQASTDNQETVMTGLEEVVNDIAFRFWKCSRCLGMDHQLSSCTNKIRCRGCYRYGHKEKNCLNKAGAALGQWIPKRAVSAISTLSIPKLPLADSTSDTRQNPSPQPLSPLSHNESPPLSSQQPPPTDLLHSAMAVFELDPTPWLPWRHQVIDGGDTRLPRSFYNPMSDPPLQDQDSCIAIVDPAPLAIHEGHWRDRMSSPSSREALVQHGPFHIEHNVFVRFINPDAAPENFRSIQGFRTGWLMFLGIPPAYRNDYDIANAISTFGKFHY
jgi:hypothetical protein